jgi:hypothetical protein
MVIGSAIIKWAMIVTRIYCYMASSVVTTICTLTVYEIRIMMNEYFFVWKKLWLMIIVQSFGLPG